MLRLFVVSIFMISTITFAHDDDAHVGSATHSGAGKVSHEGDFIEFSFNFDASCYADQNSPRTRVIENVESFVQWLEGARTSYQTGGINYTTDLINVWRNDYYHGGSDNPCFNKYSARQSVTITLNKLAGDIFLDSELIQRFFNDLQVTIAPLNFVEDSDFNAGVATKITSVQKGVFEETAELLRIAAKAKAQASATRDFIAFLGNSYQGWWHLHSVDFSNERNYRDLVTSVGLAERSDGNTGGPVLSVLKLEPITLDVDGTFVFHFQAQDNHLPR